MRFLLRTTLKSGEAPECDVPADGGVGVMSTREVEALLMGRSRLNEMTEEIGREEGERMIGRAAI